MPKKPIDNPQQEMMNAHYEKCMAGEVNYEDYRGQCPFKTPPCDNIVCEECRFFVPPPDDLRKIVDPDLQAVGARVEALTGITIAMSQQIDALCQIILDKDKEGGEDDAIIEDSLGNVWSIICPDCGNYTMHVVGPGKVQCGACGEDENEGKD